MNAASKMLRMRPTKIELNPRDHDWHIMRHEHRQSQRARGSPLAVGPLTFPYSPLRRFEEDKATQCRSPSPSSSEDSGIIAGPHIPRFSKRPDMHKFWSGVVAGAGLLPEVRSLHAAKPVSIKAPSDHILETQSVNGSIEENRNAVEDQDQHQAVDSSKRESRQRSSQSQRHRRRWSPLTTPPHSGGSSRDSVSGTRRSNSNLRALDGSSDPSPSPENLYIPSLRISYSTALAIPSLNLHRRSPLYISHLAASSSPERLDLSCALTGLSIDSRDNDFTHSHPSTEGRIPPHFRSPYDSSLTIPPHPFSAVRRAVSSTPALPSVSPFSSPGRNFTPAYSNSSGSLSITTPPHSTPHYFVYDDRLPAVLQPRTPAGLSTNGLHGDGLSSGYRAFTAPARATRRGRRQPSREMFNSGSPRSRRSGTTGQRGVDQGNEHYSLEAEGSLRRPASLRQVSLALDSDDSDY